MQAIDHGYQQLQTQSQQTIQALTTLAAKLQTAAARAHEVLDTPGTLSV